MNNTITINDFKSKMMTGINQKRKEIRSCRIKMEKNNFELTIIESELSDLKMKRLIYRYYLKEIYLELMADPDKIV